jgi:DNA-binding response OmpR family regulator
MSPDLPIKIVYIDDDPDMIELVRLILCRNGYEVKGSTSGLYALELIRKEAPDLILLDLMIPDMDGWEILAKIRSSPGRLAKTPVIIITAKSFQNDNILTIKINKVDDYISKPFLLQELLASIQKVLNKKSAS